MAAILILIPEKPKVQPPRPCIFSSLLMSPGGTVFVLYTSPFEMTDVAQAGGTGG